MSFDRFYVCPLSAPTRAELLTGRYFLRTGVSSVSQGSENMDPDEKTIAMVLRENGYTTGCFGKWHNGGYYLQHPNRKGFDEFTGFCVGHLGYYYNAVYLHNDDEIKSSGYSTDFFTDEALGFIRKNSSHPFLCYVAYNVPHSPFQVPQEYFTKYKSKGLNDTLSVVYGMVDNMDRNVDRILSVIDSLGIRNNTIVIFFSDNGPNTRRYNGNMKGIKGSVDEGGIRVPFYINWPGHIKPGTTTQLGQDIDIFPTLISMCNVKYHPGKKIDGTDLSGIISGQEKPYDRLIFSRQAILPLSACRGSVRDDNYRLVITGTDTMLYDMKKDPSQKKDIYSGEKDIGGKLKTEFITWQKDMTENYRPCDEIEVGFEGEQSFTLPVQDAVLSGRIRFSSIYPNQSNTENWVQNGDSIYWRLNVSRGGNYIAMIRYGCPASETGSEMVMYAGDNILPFRFDQQFESVVLPDRDYVKRGEALERTWGWMNLGDIHLSPGKVSLVIRLVRKSADEAGLIRSVKFVRR
jgi:arylsulfatase A-like enzyme